ncbi:MAG: hypothetical protein IKY90_07335 [Oscillospiraceae bacterium]|nr:hypothetical protein [Oscillospiraceae bacterium]
MRPIDADALQFKPCVLSDDVGFSICSAIKKSEIDAAPTLDYAPVKHGFWKKCGQLSRTQWLHRCSLCGCPQDYAHNYCPNCGARMDGEQ